MDQEIRNRLLPYFNAFVIINPTLEREVFGNLYRLCRTKIINNVEVFVGHYDVGDVVRVFGEMQKELFTVNKY